MNFGINFATLYSQKTMIITYNRERLINSIIYFTRNTKHCGKTKLLKLLYFMDFCHFRQTGKSVTGLDYCAWEKGPVAPSLFEELSRMKPDMDQALAIVPDDDFQQIKPKKIFDAQYFTPRQLKLLKELAFIFKDAKANEMIEATHLRNEPWDKTKKYKGMFKKIDYLLSIDGSKDCLNEDEALERMEEIEEMHKIFGTT